MQYKSQEAAMQARSLDGRGKSHSNAPESGKFGGASRSTTMASTPDAGVLAETTREMREFLADLADRTRRNVRAADAYVHAQPWKAIGAGAAAGLVLGFLLARRPSS